MSTLVLTEQRSDILASLRRLRGRGTVGDVVSDSGLPSDSVRDGLKALLESHRGHLAVSDSGELVYEFEPKLIERGSEPRLVRLRRAAGKIVTVGFKAWIVIMLVGYFVVFVALVIAALIASQRGGDSKGGWGGGRRSGHRGGGFGFNPIFWYWVWGPRWRIGRPYYGHRWERTLSKDDKVPFYKKVFAFVFGPDRPEPTQKQLDRATLRLIRSKKGVVSTAELVGHRGTLLPEAESEMARLLGAYDGEAVVSPDGELVYAFPGVMKSVEMTQSVRAPNPTWRRLEHPRELTGNTGGANATVVAMNTFTLVAAASSPWFIFPRLGLAGAEVFVGLVLVPVVFSSLFFAGPLLRMVGVRLENRRRRKRNVRRVLLGFVYERTLSNRAGVGLEEAIAFVSTRLAKQTVSPADIERAFHALAAEFEADVSVSDEGAVSYRFDSIREQFTASELMRKTLRLDRKRLGPIVYATSDSGAEAVERDLALFDATLKDKVTLRHLLPSVDRIDFEDEFEVVAFEEELKRR